MNQLTRLGLATCLALSCLAVTAPAMAAPLTIQYQATDLADVNLGE